MYTHVAIIKAYKGTCFQITNTLLSQNSHYRNIARSMCAAILQRGRGAGGVPPRRPVRVRGHSLFSL